MGLFGIGKKEDVVDLSERYKIQQKRAGQTASKVQATNSLGFLGNLASGSASNSSNTDGGYVNLSENEDKKRTLSKKLIEMTNRIEDLSNQIYHLKQRVELLEKKLKINFE